MHKIANAMNEILQRALCRTKPHAYFLHSQQAFPSILLVTKQHQQALKPLLYTLTRNHNYPLISTIEQHTVKSTKVETPNTIKSIQGIELGQSALLIRIGEEGKLEVTPRAGEAKGQVVGALLFAPHQEIEIRHGHNIWMENAVFLFRLGACIGLWQLYRALWESTRLQNHPQ